MRLLKSKLEILLFVLIMVMFISNCAQDGGDDDTGDDDTDDDDVEDNLPWLHAEGTNIVDEFGNIVRLKGVNFGGWLFNETWITHIDYPLHGRIRILGYEEGIGEMVDKVLIAVGMGSGGACGDESESWLDAFYQELKNRIGAGAADEFMTEVEKYPALCDDSDLPLRLVLEERFGTNGRDELLDIFQKAWMKESDITWLAEQGFNVVRVPISYRTLVKNTDKDKPENLDWNERAFERLDELLNWCNNHRVYAVLDIQEAPGGQNDYSGEPTLYTDPKMQALTVELWDYISDRYKERSVVAAYSLLAEPFGAPSSQARDDMYDKLVKSIRAGEDAHLLVIHDGFMGMSSLPEPSQYGWDNVVYSTHLFEWSADSLSDYELLIKFYDALFSKAQSKQNVPYYIGSFSTMRDEDWAYDALGKMVSWFNGRNWSWSLWTHKRFDDPISKELYGYTTAWGLLSNLYSSFDRPDVYRDSKEALKTKFAAYADLVLEPNWTLLYMLQNPK